MEENQVRKLVGEEVEIYGKAQYELGYEKGYTAVGMKLFEALKELYPHCHETDMKGETDYERAWLKCEEAIREYESQSPSDHIGEDGEDLYARYIIRYAGKVFNQMGNPIPELMKDMWNFFKPHITNQPLPDGGKIDWDAIEFDYHRELDYSPSVIFNWFRARPEFQLSKEDKV